MGMIARGGRERIEDAGNGGSQRCFGGCCAGSFTILHTGPAWRPFNTDRSRRTLVDFTLQDISICTNH
jgi:hypothetical protein